MDAPLVIRFKPERKDYVLASRALAMKSTSFIIIAVVFGLAMIAAAVVLIFPSIGDAVLRNVAVVVLLVGAFYIIYFTVIIPWQLSRAYTSNEYLQQAREFTFSESGVAMAIGDKMSNLIWENFKDVIDGGGFYLLLYEGENRVYPFIPKRAFTTEASEDAFRAVIREKGITIK